MDLDLSVPVKDYMTKDLLFVNPDSSMLRVAEVFSGSHVHHLPVLDTNGKAVGLISKSDYHKLLHHFTLLHIGDHAEQNKKFLSSLIASDVMQKKLFTVDQQTPLKQVLEAFLDNLYHSIIITEKDLCVGIITPYDFLKVVAQ